jgi:hypothetical protein
MPKVLGMAHSYPAKLSLFVVPACGEGEEEGKTVLPSSPFAFSNLIRIRLALFPFCAAISPVFRICIP